MAEQSTNPPIMESKSAHPLQQIAETPTHKLLLKQWLKEEELILGRVGLKETQIDSVRKEITHLYIFFFLFHSLSLVLLFTHASANPRNVSCSKSYIPSLCSLLCSLGMIWAVRYKTDVEGHLQKLLEREKEDGKLLGKCVEELKRKGLEFDLLKEVDALRRAKSLRVEGKEVFLALSSQFTSRPAHWTMSTPSSLPFNGGSGWKKVVGVQLRIHVLIDLCYGFVQKIKFCSLVKY